MSPTARRFACQTSSRGHPTIRLFCAADNSEPACESEAVMERLHSGRRRRSRIVLAEKDRRFIRQVPADEWRGVLPSGEHETEAAAEKVATRVGFKGD